METIRRNLGRYRNEIKGIAILWVCFFHAKLGLDGFLYQVQRIGYGGVDIFFFISGFGLYHSLAKDDDPGRYMKRRADRLLPSYLPFCLIWLAVVLPLSGEGLTGCIRIALSNLSMLGFMTGSPLYINWYTGALFMSMVLAPFFFAALKPGKRFWLRAAALLGLLFMVGLGFVGDYSYMFVSRLPVMVLGMITAGCSVSLRKLKWIIPALLALGAAALAVLYRCLDQYQELLITYAMYWHPFALITPALCIALGWLFSRIPSSALKPLHILGAASFEIFLCNAGAEVLGSKFGLISTPMEWLGWTLGSVALGLAYHWLVGRTWKSIKQKIRECQ